MIRFPQGRKPVMAIQTKIENEPHVKNMAEMVTNAFQDNRFSIISDFTRTRAMKEATLIRSGILDDSENKDSVGKMVSADFILDSKIFKAEEEPGYRVDLSLTNAKTAERILSKQFFCEDQVCIRKFINKFTRLYELEIEE